MRIVVIDDNALDREQARRLLPFADVEGYATAVEARSVVSAADAVLCDRGLTEAVGHEVVETVRYWAKGKPVFVWTGDTGLRGQADTYIKGEDDEALVERLQEMVG